VLAAVELAASRRLGTPARRGYGTTEATTMISGPAGLGRPGEPGTVGWLAPGTEARLVDDPTPRAGEVPVAYVVLAGPATSEELIAFAAPRLSAHKQLRDVRVIDQLPRAPSGKLQLGALRDRERRAAGHP
jgi:acyl-coenzyme A synthetase/AMP-(fatty) acid ligase